MGWSLLKKKWEKIAWNGSVMFKRVQLMHQWKRVGWFKLGK